MNRKSNEELHQMRGRPLSFPRLLPAQPTRFTPLVFLVVLFVTVAACFAETVRVEGVVTYTAYSQENHPAAIAKRRFICRLEGPMWSVVVSNVWPSATNHTILYYESASLGEDVCSLEVRSGSF